MNDHLAAHGAGLVGAVQCGSVNGNTQFRGLYNGILLRVHRVAGFHPGSARNPQLIPQAFALLAACLDARRRAVVSGGHNPLVLHDHAADAASRTGKSSKVCFSTSALQAVIVGTLLVL